MGEKIELDIDPFGRCQYCTEEGMAALGRKGVIEHLMVFKRQDGHIHVHGPIKNEALIIEMIQAICRQVDIGLSMSGKESMNPRAGSQDYAPTDEELERESAEGETEEQ